VAALPRRHRAPGVPPALVEHVSPGERTLRRGNGPGRRSGCPGVGARLPVATGAGDAAPATPRPAYRVLSAHPFPARGTLRAVALALGGARGSPRIGSDRIPAVL